MTIINSCGDFIEEIPPSAKVISGEVIEEIPSGSSSDAGSTVEPDSTEEDSGNVEEPVCLHVITNDMAEASSPLPVKATCLLPEGEIRMVLMDDYDNTFCSASGVNLPILV